MAEIFEIQQLNPETYRRQTRRSTLIVALTFIALAMLLSTGAVMLFGTPGGDNFRWNIGAVISALVLTVALVRMVFWPQPWMAAAVYGWRLKRSLMRITNVMHHVNAGVAASDPNAMQLLRFYHLGVSQMHELDGNSSALSDMRGEIEQHRQHMNDMGLNGDQPRLDSAWLEAVKKIGV